MILFMVLPTMLFSAEYVNIGLSYNSSSFVSYFANVNLLYLSAINDVNSSDVFEIYDVYTSSIIYRGKNTITISVSGTRIQVGSLGSYTGPLIFRPLINATTIYVRLSKNGSTWRSYRGYIQFSISGSYFKIINIVDIEEYLYGVLPSEIGAWAHIEAQKAQAVSARTFFKKNITRHSSEGYSLCDTEHCQVYGGKSGESFSARQAVLSTKGEVMKYNGAIIYTYYFSCCGGRTANCSDVWSGSYPYLISVVDDPDEIYDTNDTDDYCYNDSNYYWTYNISHTSLETRLKSNSYTAPANSNSTLAENGISTTSVDTSGRIKYFRIQYINPDQIKEVSGTNFRAAVGNANLKSTLLLNIAYDEITKTYTFSGKGSGHGVGMCQAGADSMGRKGFSYIQILQHYYKGVIIDDVSPPVITHTPPNEVLVNSSFTITAYVTDSNGVSSVKVFYRSSGQQSYYFQNMLLTSGNYYSAVIPAGVVIPSGVEYYIEATDNNSNISYFASPGQPQYVRVVITDTSPPVISHTPVSTVVEGTTITIVCTVTDASGVSNVTFYYKNSIMSSYT
ncbi:MAG: SpoIID/LytB domain-containing protein, partial [Endomicrobia bacterium]|nr:SpoIID/LytB domain-containing protein [Endomicrobiia bacterium]